MKITNLTFIVTDDCNFNCSYCVQHKEKNRIANETIDLAVNCFYPLFKGTETVYIGFYGGEPLLAYEQVKHAVNRVQEKNTDEQKPVVFSLTTNGTLLTEEMLDFFNRHRFALTLSFDGLAQEACRKSSTIDQMVQWVKRIRQYGAIDFEINSVFTPATVSKLSGSMRFMIEPGGPEVTFNLSTMEEWQPGDLETLKAELDRLSDYLYIFYKKTGKIPVKNFHLPGSSTGSSKSIFRCGAGSERMAVAPDGKIWGCYLFHDYFKTRRDDPQYKDYYLGTIEEFSEQRLGRGEPCVHPKTVQPDDGCYQNDFANYADLRQDMFKVGENYCFLCPGVGECMVCPVYAAYSTGSVGTITCRHCALNKIQITARTQFQERIK